MILVLEDDDFLRKALVQALEEEDYNVVEAAGAEQAAVVARQNDLELVIADVRLGEIDGLEFLAQLRRFKPEVKSIVMTGYASSNAPSRALRVKAEDYLYKPFELDDMLDAVERVLGAEEEKASYSGLLGGLLAGYKKVIDAAGAALTSAGLKSIDSPRDSCFSAFYVGVRSRKLKQHEAFDLWGRVEALENVRQEILKATSPHLNKAKTLAGEYEGVRELIVAVSKTTLPIRSTGDSSCPPQRFSHLFEAIHSGSVSTEQLKQAPVLRSLDPLTLAQSAPLSELFLKLWGSP